MKGLKGPQDSFPVLPVPGPEKYCPAPGPVPQAGSLLLAGLQLGHLGLATNVANTQGRLHLEVALERELLSTGNGRRGQSERTKGQAVAT